MRPQDPEALLRSPPQSGLWAWGRPEWPQFLAGWTVPQLRPQGRKHRSGRARAGLGSVVCRKSVGKPPLVALVESPPLCPLPSPPGARLLNPLSFPLQQPWQALPSRSTLSIPRFPAGPFEWGPPGLAGLALLLWSRVGGGDLLPPCRRRTPSSHVLGRSARSPARASAAAAAAEPPARSVSVPGTRHGGEETPGEAEGWRCATGTELPLPTLQPLPRCSARTYFRLAVARSRPGGNAEAGLEAQLGTRTDPEGFSLVDDGPMIHEMPTGGETEVHQSHRLGKVEPDSWSLKSVVSLETLPFWKLLFMVGVQLAVGLYVRYFKVTLNCTGPEDIFDLNQVPSHPESPPFSRPFLLLSLEGTFQI